MPNAVEGRVNHKPIGKSVSLGTTAAPLSAASQHCRFGWDLSALRTNSGTVLIGGSGADSTDGYPLGPGESIHVAVEDLAEVFALRSGGAASLRFTMSKSPLAEATVIPNFTGSPTAGVDPQTVIFTNTSQGATSYLWQFSNDGVNWSNFLAQPTAANPTETFNQGTWSIRLRAMAPGVVTVFTRLNYISVIPGQDS